MRPRITPRGAVPDDPRPQLGELVRRVAAGEHVEHVLELLAREVGERIRAADEPVQLARPRSPRRRTIATICCASTSSGLRGIFVSSISPPRIARATTADSSRSARNFGKMRPFEIAPSSWPARPTRCSPRATDFGDSTWITRSTAPMSMPSSREEVATRHGIRPAFRSSSMSTRCSRASEPWCARAISLLGELVQPQREPLGEPAVVDEDDRRAVLLDELEDRRVDRRPDRADALLGTRRPSRRRPARTRLRERGGRPELAQVLDRHDDLEVELLARAGVDELDRAVAGDEAADLLERALRRREADPLRPGLSSSASSRSSESARWAPRLVPATACTSSRITRLDAAQRLARLRGQHQEERLGRRDQDVRRLLHELAPLLLRRVAGADADAEARTGARRAGRGGCARRRS